MPSAEQSDVFNCTVPQFFKLVTDYANYPKFLQEVKECKVVKIEGARKLVEYKVAVLKNFVYQLWMTESDPNSVTWTLASGDIFKTSDGSWTLEDVGGKCKAIYKIEANFGIFVPGPIAKTLLSVNLPTMFASYHKRVGEIYGGK